MALTYNDLKEGMEIVFEEVPNEGIFGVSTGVIYVIHVYNYSIYIFNDFGNKQWFSSGSFMENYNIKIALAKFTKTRLWKVINE